MQKKEIIARVIIANRTTTQLCEMFEATNEDTGAGLPAEARLRGWIMDELEKRDVDAFNRWLDCEDCKLLDLPSHFFLAV